MHRWMVRSATWRRAATSALLRDCSGASWFSALVFICFFFYFAGSSDCHDRTPAAEFIYTMVSKIRFEFLWREKSVGQDPTLADTGGHSRTKKFAEII